MPRPGLALLGAILLTTVATLSEVRVDYSNNGSSVQAHVGDVVKVSLNTTEWTFDQSSDPGVVEQMGDQTVMPDPIGSCLPGMGCGLTTAWYKARSAGTATVSATRLNCGEARRCVGEEGIYRVTVVVT